MPSIELLLEAERRGILPEDKKSLLDEARKRGLIQEQSGEIGIGLAESVNPKDLSISQDYPGRNFAMQKLVRPTLEGLGLVGGGLAGIPLAPATGGLSTVGGAGLGYAGMKSLSDFLEVIAGTRKPLSLSQNLQQIPLDVATGASMEMGGQIFGKGIEKLSAPLASSVTPAMKERISVAQQENVPSTAAEVTQSRPLSQAENFLANVPGSAGIMQRQHQIPQSKAMEEIRKRIVRKNIGEQIKPIEEVGQAVQGKVKREIAASEDRIVSMLQQTKEAYLGLRGTTAGKLETGQAGKNLLTEKSKAGFGEVVDEYANLPIQGNEKLSTKPLVDKATELLSLYGKKQKSLQDETIKGLLENISQGHIPPEIQNQIKSLGSTPGEQRIKTAILKEFQQPKLDWESIKLLRQDLNQLIKSEDVAIKLGQGGYKGLSTPEGGIAKELKKALDDVIEAHSVSTGGQLKPAFEKATSTAKEFYEIFRDKNVKQMLGTNPERVFDIVTKSPTAFGKLKEAVGDEGVEPIRRLLVNDILGPGELSSKTIQRNLARYGENVSHVLGKNTAKELEALAMGVKRIEDIPISSDFFKLIAKTQPEKVFDTVLKSTQGKTIYQVDAGNILRLRELKPIIGEKGISDIKNTMMERALELDKTGLFNPASALKTFNSFGPRTAKELLGEQGLKDMTRLAQLEQFTRGASRLAANPSGTGQSLISAGYFGMVLKGYGDAVKLLFHTEGGILPATGQAIRTTVGVTLLPQGLAKIYLSDVGRKYLISAYEINPSTKQSAELGKKLLAIAGTNGYRLDE